MTQNTPEYEYLALVINYNEFLGRTILKKQYFEYKNRIMFDILMQEYEKNKVLNLTELSKYKDFDMNYYFELFENNLYNSSRERQFKILEKNVIEAFKDRTLKQIISKYNGNQQEFYKTIEKLKMIDVEENEYITKKDMLEILSEEQSQIKLGFYDLDKTLYISQNDFVVLAGGTGTGKTTFALNLLSNLSKNYQCVYFNMEMSKKTLYKRLCAIETGYDITKFNNIGNFSKDELNELEKIVGELEERKIILINNSQTIDTIEKIIARIKTNKKLIIILDHIGLINAGISNLYEKMTYIAKKIRGICLDYNCTIFGLCQLSRESQKEERQPKLQDLRDSGEIEQSARKVLLLYNKDIKKQVEIKNVDLLVAKNDDGNCIIKSFEFDVKKQSFKEVNYEKK